MPTSYRALSLAAACLLACCSWAEPLPDLVPTVLNVPTNLAAPMNPMVQLSWAIKNSGQGSANGYWNDQIFLSTRTVLDSTAILVGVEDGPGMVEPGETYWRTTRVTLPINQAGQYYLIVKANAFAYLPETTAGNNQLAAGFTFQPTPADLAPITLSAPANVSGPPDPVVTLAWGVTNIGSGYARGSWGDAVFLSTTNLLDMTAIQVAYQNEYGPVPASTSYWRTNSIQLPVSQSGLYHLFFITDPYNNLLESRTNNNLVEAVIYLEIQPPDLAPFALLAPRVVTSAPNPTITFAVGVTNQGTGIAVANPYWFDRVYLSTNATADWNDPMVTDIYETGPVAPGQSYWSTNSARLGIVDSGTYYLIYQANMAGFLKESETTNNVLSTRISFDIVRPDLVPITRLPLQVTGPPYPMVDLVMGATNQGPGAAEGYWSDYVYLSTDTNIDSQDTAFGFGSLFSPVPPGGTYLQTNTFHLPVTQDGTYYFIAKVDQYQNLYESDRSNNVVIQPVTVHILPPDLAPIALQIPNVMTSPPNPEIDFVWGITNQGLGPAIGNWYWSDLLYFSSNSVLDTSATQLNSSYESGPVAAGASYWRTNSLHVPVTRSGTYYFFLETDAYGSLIETTDQNNLLTVPVTFIVQPPDLVPLVSRVPQTFSGPPNQLVTLVWGVTNQGSGNAKGYWSGWPDGVFFSTNAVLDERDTDISPGWQSGPVAPGASSWQTNIVRLPVSQSGSYYLIFKADRNDYVYEENKSNNIVVVPITVTVLPPDLVPIAPKVPALVTGPPNPSLDLIWGVTNQGVGPAEAGYSSWSDDVYLSSDSILDSSDIAIAYRSVTGPVGPSDSYWGTNTIRLPLTKSTQCFLIFKTDDYNGVVESNETNNTVAVPLTVQILPPDLVPLAFLAPTVVTGPPTPVVTFVWGVTNQGQGPAEPYNNWSWYDRLVISTNNFLDNTVTNVGGWYETTPLAAGGSYWRTNSLTLPVLASGTYYLFFSTDASRSVAESTFTNNTAVLPITFTVQPPDLAVIGLVAPAQVIGPPEPTLTLAYGVTNQGIGPAVGYWTDPLWLSSRPVFDYSAIQIGRASESGPVEPGESYWRTNTIKLPVIESGTYYILFETDSGNLLHESDGSNNRGSIPITVDILPPDLTPVALIMTNRVVGPPNPTVTMAWGVTNQGLGAAIGDAAWLDQVSLCPTFEPDVACAAFGNWWENGTVLPGDTYWRTNDVTVPVVASGTYFIRFSTDGNRSLVESSFANNDLTLPVTFEIQPPDLKPLILQAPTQVTGPASPRVKLSWGVTNQGPGTAFGNPPWSDYVYLSSSQVIDQSAQAVAWSSEFGPVAPRGNYWRSQTVTLPTARSGNYYLIFLADQGKVLYDPDYSNNTVVVPISLNITPPDLAVLGFFAPSNITSFDLTNIAFVWGVTNQGSGTALLSGYGNWCDSVSLSTSPEGAWNDTWLGSICATDPLPPGGSYWRTNTVPFPLGHSGSYYFILRLDSNNMLAESNETNNFVALPVQVEIQPPDLAPIALQVPPLIDVPPGPTFSLVFGITNQGPGLAMARDYWLDELFLSQTNVLDGTEVAVGWFFEQQRPVLPGGSYWQTNSIHLPVYQSGSYYLHLKTDAYDSLEESNESNNVMSIPFTLETQPSDVVAFGIEAPGAVTDSPYPTVNLSWGVTNQGPGKAVAGWGWWQQVFVSTEPVLDSNAVYAFAFNQTNDLPSGAWARFTNQVMLPITTNGQYYVLVCANANNALAETNTNNDVASIPLNYSMRLPDLAPVTLSAPAKVTSPPDPWVSLSWGVTNQGSGSARARWPWYSGSWYDLLWLSASSNLDATALYVLSVPETNDVASGESYWRTNLVRLPVSQSGHYYLVLNVNSEGSVTESNWSNNLVTVPIEITIAPPDLTPFLFQAPQLVKGAPDPEMTVVWGVTNQGTGSAESPDPYYGNYFGFPADALYFSTKPVVDNPWDPSVVTVWPLTNTVAPGASYTRTNTLRVPVSNSGTYYLILRTDAFQAIEESNELNNTVVTPITFELSPPADLKADAFLTPRVIAGPGNPVLSLAWHVINQGLGPTGAGWWDTVTLGGPAISQTTIGSFWASNELLPGNDYWKTNSVILPITESGEYQLTFQTGIGPGVFDLDPLDNWLTVPLTVDITAPPDIRLSDPQWFPTGFFRLSVYGVIGAAYTLEASEDLQTWVRVVDFSCVSDPTVVYDPGARQLPARFYRVTSLTHTPTPSLSLAPVAITSSGVWLALDGLVGVPCQIEASTDLVSWQKVTIVDPVVMPMYVRDPSTATDDQRFYRAVQPPPSGN
jgi:subtilase family serine protease